MTEKIDSAEGLSRRSFISTTGKVLAGAAVAGTIAGNVNKASAYETGAKGYKYAKIDPDKVAQIAYENYPKRWCASSVMEGLVHELRDKAGGKWKELPVDAMRWAHGGLAGWGALCGTLTGAGAIIGLATDDTDTAEAMVNDLAFFYSYRELPSFKPKKNIKADIYNMTISGTPVCHISVGKWMRQEGAAFLSDERAERCARLAANIAKESAIMLNAWKDGTYEPKHKPLFNVAANGITSQNNCTDCHGNDVPFVETYSTLEK